MKVIDDLEKAVEGTLKELQHIRPDIHSISVMRENGKECNYCTVFIHPGDGCFSLNFKEFKEWAIRQEILHRKFN